MYVKHFFYLHNRGAYRYPQPLIAILELMGEEETLEFQEPKENKVERWGYETHFKPYLLLLARKGEQGLEETKNFPKTIELSSVWHKTFNLMREKTKDGYERWALIGYQETKNEILLPNYFYKGSLDGIPSEIKRASQQQAKEKHQIEGRIGDIHSHPPDLPDFIREEMGISKGFDEETDIEDHASNYFSPSDVFTVIDSSYNNFIAAMVSPTRNALLMRTRETVGPGTISKDNFENYWFGQYGTEYVGEDLGLSPSEARQMNLSIADYHHLVLYQGEPDQDLKRIFPEFAREEL